MLLLFLAAEGIDRIHHQRRLHTDERAHTAVSTLQFLCNQAVFHIRHACATVALETGAEESQFSHRLHQFAGKAAGAVAVLNDGDEIVFNESTSGIADEALVVSEQRVEFEEIDSSELDSHDVLFLIWSLAQFGSLI